MNDLIKYDRECNYIDMRNQNSNNILNECSNNKNNITDVCNLKNSDLNTINEKTDKFMNENVFNVSIDNNILNKTSDPLNKSLNLNQNDTLVYFDSNKNYNLNIYPKKIEDNIFSIALTENGNKILEDNKLDEKYSDNNNNKFDIINKKETTLLEESLNNINNGNDITKFNNKNQNVNILELYEIQNNNIDNEQLLNEQLQ